MEKSILVVDDDRRSLSFLDEALYRAGYISTTISAEQVDEGRFDELRPDLIFISLDADDSIKLCTTIRDRPDGAILPIIFVAGSNDAQMDSPKDALAHGGDYVFSHPLEMSSVLEKVKTYLGAGVVRGPVPKTHEPFPEEKPEAGSNTLASASDALLAKIEEQEAAMRAELEARDEQERLDREQQRRRREETERQERQRKQLELERRQREEEAEQKQRQEEEKRQREQEAEQKQRQEEEKRRREEEAEQKQRQEEEKRQREQEAEQKQRQEEERRQREQEAEQRQRQEEEKRQREEEAEQKQRQEEEKRQREEEAEQKQRQEEEKRRREEEAEQKQRQEEEKRRREEAVADRPEGFEPSTGQFDRHSDIAILVYRIWKQQSTGRLRLTSHHHQKSLFFEDGQPVGASSSQTHDRMEEFLRRENKITRAQYQEVRIKGLHEPRRIVGYLATEGYLKAAEIFDMVQRHLESIVFSIFEFEEGDYVFSGERIDEDQRVMLSLSTRELITEGIRRKYLLPRLIERVGAPSSLIGPLPGATHDTDSLGLTKNERQICRLVDGTRNIEDLVFSTGLGAQRVYHVLASLLTTEAAEVLVRGIDPGNPDGSPASDAIDRARIKDKYETTRQEDYFAILGVSRSATLYEIQQAFDRHWQDYSRSRFSEAICTELANELDEIEQVLQDARDILSDDALRESYSRHLSPR